MDARNPAPPEVADRDYQPLPYSFVSLEGFLNARLLTEVLDRVGPDLRRDRVKDAAESIRDLDLGVVGAASFGPGMHQATHQVYFTVAEDGRFVRLPDEEWQKRWGR